MACMLPDLCDANPEIVRVADPVFRCFGGRASYGGPITTVKCFEDNSALRHASMNPVAGVFSSSTPAGRCAVLGDNLARRAADHCWQGVRLRSRRR
jgi:regulator of ribonuclease activity A